MLMGKRGGTGRRLVSNIQGCPKAAGNCKSRAGACEMAAALRPPYPREAERSAAVPVSAAALGPAVGAGLPCLGGWKERISTEAYTASLKY